MPVQFEAMCKDVAEGILYDLKQPTSAACLSELEQEARTNEKLTEYPEWKKAFDKLLKAVGIEKDKYRGGIKTTSADLRPDGVQDLTLAEMKALATFTLPDNEAGRRSVQSARASYFLGQFQKNYGAQFMAIVQEKALGDAAHKLTDFWRKHVELMADVAKDVRFSVHKPFIEGMNHLAVDDTFGYSIGTGFARPDHFTVDTMDLGEAAAGKGRSAVAVSQLGTEFFKMSRTAEHHSLFGWETRLRTIQQDYYREVKPAMENLKALTTMLESMRAAQVAAASYRTYT